MDGNVAAGPFMIGTTKVIPNLSATYTRRSLPAYTWVYNAATDQTTLRPAVDVVYVLLKDGKELFQQSEDWREVNDAGQRLTLTRLIDTRSLAEGEYQIQIKISDRITGQPCRRQQRSRSSPRNYFFSANDSRMNCSIRSK